MKNRVREFRKEMGMSIAELARRAKTSRQTIYAIENEEREEISGMLMFRIADALKQDDRVVFCVDYVTQEVQHTESTQKEAIEIDQGRTASATAYT